MPSNTTSTEFAYGKLSDSQRKYYWVYTKSGPYYLWQNTSQLCCEDECQPVASEASGGDNPDIVVRF